MAPEILAHLDPAAVELTLVIRAGDHAALRRMLAERPGLARVRMATRLGAEKKCRTPLHVTTDWPGYFPGAPASATILIEAGADVDDDGGGTETPETPLHWAASTDDVDVAAVLIDAGADLERPNGSIGTPLDNAIGYGCWHVARLLVERGAVVDKLWHAAALGKMSRVDQLLAATPPPGADEIDNAFWQACHGGQRRVAERLLAAGADVNVVPDYADVATPLDTAVQPDTRRDLLATWLREQGGVPGSASS